MAKQLRWIVLTAAFLAFGLIQFPASACGGFFCSNTPIDQNAERIIFAVDRSTQTITAVVGINYTGEAKDFSWVVPVPSVPKLDVAETASLDLLQAGTNKQISAPPNYCDGLTYIEAGGGGGGGEVIQGNVGPYDYAIIRNTNPAELVQWLRDNGYRVTDDMIPIIKHYVDDGMLFLAMKLSQDATVGDIQPVVMTYKDENPMIPIRLTAVAAVPDMSVITWIFADTQYVPKNYAHPAPDYTTFRGSSQITTPQGFGISPISVYAREEKRIQTEYDGRAFITEYAGASSDLRPAIQDDPLLSKLIAQYPYITRLRAQMSPEQMTIDPIFIPDPSAPDVSETVDLNDYVDPLQYWGCSSRSIRDTQTEALLPEVTRIDDLRMAFAHPAGWVLSQFEYDSKTVWVLAPQTVGASDVDTLRSGKGTMPILLVSADYALFQDLSNVRYRQPLYEYRNYSEQAINYVLLATDQQQSENKDLYNAMLNYPDTYQYYASSQLQNTPFLESGSFGSSDTSMPYGFIGYPDGWIEHWDQAAVMSPENAAPNSPSARVLSLAQYFPPAETPNLYPSQTMLDNVADFYKLDDAARQTLHSYKGICTLDIQAVPFDKDGRRGYIRLVGSMLVEASAAEADFAQYDTVLRQIADSAGIPDGGCG